MNWNDALLYTNESVVLDVSIHLKEMKRSIVPIIPINDLEQSTRIYRVKIVFQVR